eukprot:CAMPEP_0194267616 /NCGR_PEP_ID=MMETSP0169-20130528/2097_1 /TAXON_ID=218684 /ORGANISM="Corethron pennatum, Strain L29A3" /LENGTH=32 /DNA_ID= /DNA_START= /DNA_END= /DNA_ORIENTATION=
MASALSSGKGYFVTVIMTAPLSSTMASALSSG